MSVVGVPMLLGPVLGPVLGGVLVTHVSWRWIFHVNLPIGFVGLFQIGRGLSPLGAGLLMAPQGLGAALGMNRAGRLTDRVAGGPVVVAGLLALMLGTVAFSQVRPDTPSAPARAASPRCAPRAAAR